VQIIQDAILVPRIMGKATGLNPAMMMLSLSIWGKLLGLLGMIIALPVTYLLLVYYRRLILVQKPVINNSP
jgi:predicted PurR-regulated permease PerM